MNRQVWGNSSSVIVGTKCNALVRLDLVLGQAQLLSLPPAPRLAPAPSTDCGIHAVALSPTASVLATGGRHASDIALLRAREGGAASPSAPHESPSPAWTPLATLVGHKDWLFDLAWVDECHLLSAGRDRTLALWDVERAISGVDVDAEEVARGPAPSVLDSSSARARRNLGAKARAVVCSRRLGALSLTTDGMVRTHDLERGLQTVDRTSLPPASCQELCCLAASEALGLAAAGSSAGTALLDPGRSERARVALLPGEEREGARAVAAAGNLLAVGGGLGKVRVYDLRKLPASSLSGTGKVSSPGLQLEGSVGGARPAASLRCSGSWLAKDATYWEHFAGRSVAQASLCLAWDASGQRLFGGGGPLASGLRGSCWSLWH